MEGNMLSHTKRLFQLSLIPFFTALLFLGTMGANSALADGLPINVVIKEKCHNDTDKPTKRIIKSGGSFQYTKNAGNLSSKNGLGHSPFPLWDSSLLEITEFEIISGDPEILFNTNNSPGDAGIALTKNLKTGTFQTIVNSAMPGNPVGNRFMALSGKLVVGEFGQPLKVVGKITGYDGTRNCTYVGKFKGKAP
jgi:hypothetical protein